MKQKIETADAPKPSGTYSQAIKAGNTIYLAGQIPLDITSGNLVSDDFKQQAIQVFTHLQTVCKAAKGNLAAVVRLTVYLTDLKQFPIVNEVMSQFFTEPYPARTTIEVSALPKGSQIEIDAIMVV